MRNLLICGSILSVLAVGCERKAEAPAAPTAAAKVEAPAVPAASTETPPTPAVDVQVPAAPAPAAMADATKTTESSAVTADAQSKLDLVVQYIKDKKYDLAEKLLSALDAQKSSLPAALQGQIATARTALNSAKASGAASDAVGGIKMPSLPK